jgi:hypothetical protein
MYNSPKFFKSILLLVAFGLLLFLSCGQLQKSPLDKLDAEISKRSVREAEKNTRVNELKKMLMDADEPGPRLKLLQKICEEYKSFSFDSASKMSLLFLSSARKFGTNADIVEATILNSYILLSAGIINQAIDSLKKAPFQSCDAALRAKYFFTLSKGYYELSNFNSEKSFAKVFQSLGNNFLDSAIACYSPESIEYQSFSGLRALRSYKLEEAKNIYEKLVVRKDLPQRQLAMEAACLANTFELLGDESKSIEYFTISAMADEASSVKEYTSLIRLAYHLFEKGDLERSNIYINLALEDANFFGSRQRKIQVLEVLPLIKAQQLGIIKQKRDNLMVFSALLFLLLIGCIWLIVLTIRQNQKIKKNEANLERYNLELEAKKAEIEEAQIIKEQYVGHFFQTNTRLINKLEKVFEEIEKALALKDLSDVKFQLSQLKPSQEKKKLLRDFDQAFLSIFPDFVKEINAILVEDYRFNLEAEKTLNTELRIFALMRMGITNNETIARALGYSVNTIYTYKTKIRNKSILSTDDFDAAIRNIQSVKN